MRTQMTGVWTTTADNVPDRFGLTPLARARCCRLRRREWVKGASAFSFLDSVTGDEWAAMKPSSQGRE